jgi:hypothetical protein
MYKLSTQLHYVGSYLQCFDRVSEHSFKKLVVLYNDVIMYTYLQYKSY